MGVPKQKWSEEEESALRAGVRKHGSGKWRTILKDPEFSSILWLRSNVDLKDKWRNMAVTAHGLGFRDRALLALKRNQPDNKHRDNSLALDIVHVPDEKIVDVEPLAVCNEMLHSAELENSYPRLENHIIEAISSLKDPTGSNKTTIAMYLENKYPSHPNFKQALSTKLNFMMVSGKLIKVKHKYRIPPGLGSAKKTSSKVLILEQKQKEPVILPKGDVTPLSKFQVDAELAKIRNMSAQEAAVAAAQAVAEAEAAMREAEEAAKEAEAAEAAAEAAQIFAEAAMKTWNDRIMGKVVTA